MANIILIPITIIYIILGICFVGLALFGQNWDSTVQEQINKIFKGVIGVTIGCIAILIGLIATLIVLF